MRVANFVYMLASLALVACSTTVAVRSGEADSEFLRAATYPSAIDGQIVIVRAWITLRHEDKNLWATWKDHENWKTVHCISLINYDSLDPSLDGSYVQVTGVIRNDASQGGRLIRLASCRNVAIEVAGPEAVIVIKKK